jgi:hypothetical protein
VRWGRFLLGNPRDQVRPPRPALCTGPYPWLASQSCLAIGIGAICMFAHQGCSLPCRCRFWWWTRQSGTVNSSLTLRPQVLAWANFRWCGSEGIFVASLADRFFRKSKRRTSRRLFRGTSGDASLSGPPGIKPAVAVIAWGLFCRRDVVPSLPLEPVPALFDGRRTRQCVCCIQIVLPCDANQRKPESVTARGACRCCSPSGGSFDVLTPANLRKSIRRRNGSVLV